MPTYFWVHPFARVASQFLLQTSAQVHLCLFNAHRGLPVVYIASMLRGLELHFESISNSMISSLNKTNTFKPLVMMTSEFMSFIRSSQIRYWSFTMTTLFWMHFLKSYSWQRWLFQNALGLKRWSIILSDQTVLATVKNRND